MSVGWKVVYDGRTPPPGAAVAPDERLSWPRTAGLGAQHVVTASVDVQVGVPLVVYPHRERHLDARVEGIAVLGHADDDGARHDARRGVLKDDARKADLRDVEDVLAWRWRRARQADVVEPGLQRGAAAREPQLVAVAADQAHAHVVDLERRDAREVHAASQRRAVLVLCLQCPLGRRPQA